MDSLSDDWINFEKDPAHMKKERERARELRKTTWWQQQLQTGRCYYCHDHFTPDELTMDHIVAVARGGKSTKGNCVPCCKACNQEKGALTPAEILMKKLDQDEDQNKSN